MSTKLNSTKMFYAKSNVHHEFNKFNIEISKMHPVFRNVQPSSSSIEIANYTLQSSSTRSVSHNSILVIKFLKNALGNFDVTSLRKPDDSRKIHLTNLGFKSSKLSWEIRGKTLGKVQEGLPKLISFKNLKTQLFLSTYTNKIFLKIYNCIPSSFKCKSTVNLYNFGLKKTLRKFFNLNMLKEILLIPSLLLFSF